MGATNIEVDWERRLLSARHEGEWTVEGSEALMAEALHLSSETGISRVLFDHRHLELDRSTIQIFRRSEDIQLIDGVERLMMALVHPAGDVRLRADYQFFEDAMANRGISIKTFDGDVEAAIAWLTA